MASEGAGVVAFPVMTLVLNIRSCVARDFSLMVHACGKVSISMSFLVNYLFLGRNVCSLIYNFMDGNQIGIFRVALL